MSFEKFGINAGILDALKKEGFKKPTPIQSRAIPALLAGSDLLGGAETGTGKTAAFTIPILDKLSCRQVAGKSPRALILVPTRELAGQVGENVKSYGRFLKLKSAEIYGGVNMQSQIRTLRRGTDILIATPGRLLDLISQNEIKLKDIEMLVLDEADRMLDMGFINDIKKILGFIPKERQTMMFSATFPLTIKKLADRMLNNPETIELSPGNTTAKTVTQSAYAVDNEKKLKLLYRLIKDKGWYQVLIFTKTKHRAQSLSLQLVKKGVPSDSIHGDKSQGARTRALKDFKSGKIQALVATDIAARGIDVSQLDCVINFQLPQQAEDYVHRIGRTGRAGLEGVAVSLISIEDIAQFRSIEKHINKKIETVILDDFVSEPMKRALEKKDSYAAGSRKSGNGNRTPASSESGRRNPSAAGRGGRAYTERTGEKSKYSRGPSKENASSDKVRGASRGRSWDSSKDDTRGASRDNARGASRGRSWDSSKDDTRGASRDNARGASRGRSRDSSRDNARAASRTKPWGSSGENARITSSDNNREPSRSKSNSSEAVKVYTGNNSRNKVQRSRPQTA